MSINMQQIIKLNNLVTTCFRRKHIIVLNPKEEYEIKENLNENIVYDKVEWEIPNQIQILVDSLSKNTQLSNEEKILLIYEKLCKDYVYDDNLISYIQKVDDDTYTLPDWYGRDVNQEWKENREQHNRRVCYEVSRYLAKALIELFKDDKHFYVTILWDKALTHYFVGVTCNEYSITLDLDDFNSIKDLTRLKTGLTAEGIIILDDKNKEFKRALDKFNEGKNKDAIKKLENEIDIRNQNLNQIEEADNIAFLKYAIEILKEESDIDSQGLYEYMKEIVDIKLGPEARKKVWKKIKENDNEETRYIRCLVLDIDKGKYLIDVDEMLLRKFHEQELKSEESVFIPYKQLISEELISYRSNKEERYKGR